MKNFKKSIFYYPTRDASRIHFKIFSEWSISMENTISLKTKTEQIEVWKYSKRRTEQKLICEKKNKQISLLICFNNF